MVDADLFRRGKYPRIEGPREHDDRNPLALPAQATDKIEPIHTIHGDRGHDQVELILKRCGDHPSQLRVDLHIESGKSKNLVEKESDGFIVVQDEDSRLVAHDWIPPEGL